LAQNGICPIDPFGRIWAKKEMKNLIGIEIKREIYFDSLPKQTKLS
jgi:hypothetical protein